MDHKERQTIIFSLLEMGSQSYTGLIKHTGFTSGKLSHHLNILRECQLITNYYPKIKDPKSNGREDYSYYCPSDFLPEIVDSLFVVMYPGFNARLEQSFQSLKEAAENKVKKNQK